MASIRYINESLFWPKVSKVRHFTLKEPKRTHSEVRDTPKLQDTLYLVPPILRPMCRTHIRRWMRWLSGWNDDFSPYRYENFRLKPTRFRLELAFCPANTCSCLRSMLVHHVQPDWTPYRNTREAYGSGDSEISRVDYIQFCRISFNYSTIIFPPTSPFQSKLLVDI